MPLATTAVLPVNSPGGLVKQLSDGNPVGTVMGVSATDKISFYGGAPIVQPGSGGPLRGQVGNVTLYTSTQSPTAVAANTTAEKAFTVTGVLATDLVLVDKPSSQAGLALATARVTAANTLGVTYANVTTGSITPTASENYTITTIPASMQQTVALVPTAVGANSTSEQVFTAAGITPGMFVAVNKPSFQAGLAILNARAFGINQIAITYLNDTGAPITPTAETYSYFAAFGLAEAPIMAELTPTLTPAAVAANTTVEQTFAVAGLNVGSFVEVSKPSLTVGLGLGGARVSAVNTLALTFVNATAASITPPSEVYSISYFPAVAPAAGSSTAIGAMVGGNALSTLVNLGLVAGP